MNGGNLSTVQTTFHTMNYKFFPHTEADIKHMLQRIGIHSTDELFADIPKEVVLERDYNLPSSLSETEIRAFFQQLGKKNQTLTCFVGAGAYDHYAPAVIGQLISRSEFFTAYTPYQPEISQGTLQYIFEFQSMIAELTGMECCNASMYDGATATAEAMFMAIAAGKKKNKILISSTLPPNVIEVVETYARFRGIELETVQAQGGVTDKADLERKLQAGGVAGVIAGSTNKYGIIEDLTGFADMAHAQKALFIVYADPSALAVLKTPAEWGADIACGDGQTLGMPLNYGGPYVGYLASTKDLLRKLPGRIVGATKDLDGDRAFVLTLQAREQHIRREKANSNICSNQSLMALYVTIYLSLMGKKGMREVNELSYAGAHYLYDQLLQTGKFEDTFQKPFLKEFTLKSLIPVNMLQQKLLDKGFFGALAVEDDKVSFCVTEKRTKEEIDQLISTIKEI